MVSSFLPIALTHIAHRRVDRGTLIEASGQWCLALCAGLLSRPASIHPEAVLATPARVRLWHGLGYRVCVWTPDSAEEIQRALDANADVVITNRPDIARPIAERFSR